MTCFRQISSALASAAVLCLAFAPDASAQSTNGLHSRQILPIVVDTASFSSRIVLTSPMLPSTATASTIDAFYVPAAGTATPAPIACTATVLDNGKTVTYGSLRELCPNLVAGSNYGYLRLTRRGSNLTSGAFSVNRGFHVFSRVSNPAGIGFSVEAFPEHAFGGGQQIVLGGRNAPATQGTPAYQTNCFVGTFADFPSGGQVQIRTTRDLLNADPSTTISLVPNSMVRLLDVFAATGATAADFDNASIVFTPGANVGNAPALMAFCTVQDNNSLGADFRIAEPLGYPRSEHASRRTSFNTDALGRGFSLAPDSYQAFFLNFRVPDTIGCELVDQVSAVPLPADSGIELFLRRADGSPSGVAVAGTAGTTGFFNVDLGTKAANGYGNPGYLLVVQSTAVPASSNINYGLVCRSGSGHSRPHRVAEGSGRLIP